MSKVIPRIAFLAETTPQLIAVMACLEELHVGESVVFFEQSLSFDATTANSLMSAAANRFPNVKFIALEISRLPPKRNTLDKIGHWPFIRRWKAIKSIRGQLDKVCQTHFQMGITAFGARLQQVYFTALHDYVCVFLAACPRARRTFYPHGFDHPRRQQVKEYTYLVGRRSLMTALNTYGQQKQHFGMGSLVLGFVGRFAPSFSTVCLPFTGVDQVLTFRSGIDYVPNQTTQLTGLKDIFEWLLLLPPWVGILQHRRTEPRGKSLLLLLGEYNRHPIWEKNCHFGLAHLLLLQKLVRVAELKRITIKAHVRSDGSAAEWLAGFLKTREPEWDVEILPHALSSLPVEALALTGEFIAAGSLGSCSLPPGLGFGMPHYTSVEASSSFDQGWLGEPFWVRYAEGARMLIAEGICLNIENSH